jgi:hypothetical protein
VKTLVETDVLDCLFVVAGDQFPRPGELGIGIADCWRGRVTPLHPTDQYFPVLIGWVNAVGPPERAGSPNRSGASSTLIGWVTLTGRLSGPAGCAKASLR